MVPHFPAGGDHEEFQLLQQMKDVLLGSKHPGVDVDEAGVSTMLSSNWQVNQKQLTSNNPKLAHLLQRSWQPGWRKELVSTCLATPKTQMTKSTIYLAIEAMK